MVVKNDWRRSENTELCRRWLYCQPIQSLSLPAESSALATNWLTEVGYIC
jgi:hypothetical protein